MFHLIFSLFLGIICRPDASNCSWLSPQIELVYYVDGDYTIENIPTQTILINFETGKYDVLGQGKIELASDPTELAKPARRGYLTCNISTAANKKLRSINKYVRANRNCWVRLYRPDGRHSWTIYVNKLSQNGR